MEMKQAKLHTAEVPDRSYQPSRSELREDLRLKGTIEEPMKALVQPVRVKRVTK